MTTTAKGQIGVGRWTLAELARGVDRYRRYLTLFGLDEDSCTGQTVCHLGCGPLGGVLAVLRNVGRSFRVDGDADQFPALSRSKHAVLAISRRTGESPVPAGCCDVVFCLGATGGTTRWYAVEVEARRMCKLGGLLYLWWRPGDDYWQHTTGRMIAKWRKTGGLTVDRMRRIFQERYWMWGQASSGMDLPNLYPAVEARWAVLTRG